MEVKVNDDLQTFGTDISGRGWACGLLAGFTGMLAYFGVGRTFMPASLEGIPSMIVAAPILLVGFWRVNNMPFEVWFGNMLNVLVFRRERRLYRACNAYQALLDESQKVGKRPREKRRKKDDLC